jgi:Xaa-Pro aminopeptidase
MQNTCDKYHAHTHCWEHAQRGAVLYNGIHTALRTACAPQPEEIPHMAQFPAQTYAARQHKLSALMRKKQRTALCITSDINIRYLTGFLCSFGRVLAVGRDLYLFTDSRYTFDARRTAAGVQVVETTALNIDRDMRSVLADHAVRELAFERDHVSHGEFLAMKKALRGVKLHPESNIVETLRLIKDAHEIRAIRRACRVGDKAFLFIQSVIKPGITERKVAAELNAYLMAQQVDALAFDSIVAAGPRGAFAHARPSDAKIKKGDLVVLDFGVRLDGYNSDMTRTVAAGKPNSELARMYEAVRRAQAAPLALAKPGVAAATLDKAARAELSAMDLEKYFTHGLGHGVGLDVHEIPRVSYASHARLKSGLVFTVEPGVYIDGLGGVRIEDTVAVTPDGIEIITKSTKNLVVL